MRATKAKMGPSQRFEPLHESGELGGEEATMRGTHQQFQPSR
jgi:hypothetical protein